MERITINIPDSQSEEIKSFLKSRGIAVDNPKSLNIEVYRKKIANIGVWTDEDLKVFDDNRKVLDNFNPPEW